MIVAVSLLLVAAGCLLSLPVFVYCLEIVVGLAASSAAPVRLPQGRRPRVAVLVPAHDEASMIAPTIADVRSQMRDEDRLLVVADNCTDATAKMAARAGAEVVQRTDLDRRGKGYALEFGIRSLAGDPPEIVVVIDADCRLGDGAIDRLAATAGATGRPAQACYLIVSPPGREAAFRIAEFAQHVKNRLRPRGLQVMNLPCQLAGSGMAFPWRIIAAADLGSGEIVEDLKLGLDFAAAEHPAIFCESAEVTSLFPSSPVAASAQRRRWQQGHLRMMVTSARKGMVGLLRGNGALVALTLDLLVPPLTLLVVLLVLLVAASAAATAIGASALALGIAATNLVALSGVTLAAWWRFRASASVAELSSIPSYIRERAAIYPSLLSRKPLQWVRTSRDGVGDVEPRSPS